MTDNEKAIIRINGLARAKGMSYGQYVSRMRLGDPESGASRHLHRAPTASGGSPRAHRSPGEGKDGEPKKRKGNKRVSG